jgi:transcriptional regulator with XRE-family HTH domain
MNGSHRVGQALREYRRRAMLSQQALAELANVSVRTIRNIESGLVVPQAASIRRLAQALELTPDGEAALSADRSSPLSPRVRGVPTRQELTASWPVPHLPRPSLIRQIRTGRCFSISWPGADWALLG